MTKCPKCGRSNLKSFGIEQGERQDDFHTTLISKFKCKDCASKFREIQTTECRTELEAGPYREPAEVWYEALIYQRLSSTKHRTKRFRFKAPDYARRFFFQRHPEFYSLDYLVSIYPYESPLRCIPYIFSDMSDIDSAAKWVLRRYPGRKTNRLLVKHLMRLAKRIELGKVGT
ncbi:MAG: hypothetical protein ABSF65_06555 [Candidatus Bathyarchaeia archaeon]|jgi:hypothetical protein